MTENKLPTIPSDMFSLTPLTREQETELFKKLRDGDESVKDYIALSNMRLVRAVASEYAEITKNMTVDDLIQEGYSGLIRAIDKFDPSRNVKFATYAFSWIQQAITRAITNEDSSIRIPVHTSDELKSVLSQLNSVDDIDLATQKDTVKDAYIARNILSLDTPLSDEGEEYTRMDVLSSNEDVEEDAMRVLINENLYDMMNNVLDDKEKFVLENLFGLHDKAPKTTVEIGKELGVTKQRVDQLKVRAIRKLRAPSNKKYSFGLKDVIYE